jgi:hypothetical protein
MGPERPDLDDYQYLAQGLPVAGLIIIVAMLRRPHPGVAAFCTGIAVGLVVGLALVAVLAVQMHMWREQVARAVVETGNPRLPLGFTLAVGVYLVGLAGAAVVLYKVYGGRGSDEFAVALILGLVAGAFLPWVILNWPMREIRSRADDLYRERDRAQREFSRHAHSSKEDDERE